MSMSVNGKPVAERWIEYGVEDNEGSVEGFDEIDEALDIVLFRRALYGPEKEGHVVSREVFAFEWKRSDEQPHKAGT